MRVAMVIFVNVFFFYGESKRNEKEPTVWIIWARGVGIKLTFFFFGVKSLTSSSSSNDRNIFDIAGWEVTASQTGCSRNNTSIYSWTGPKPLLCDGSSIKPTRTLMTGHWPK
jgi:hypothetical protein